MRIRAAFVLLAIVLLSGCAANVKRSTPDTALPSIPPVSASKLVLNVSGSPTSVGSGDWAGFKQEWQENFAEQAQVAGVAFEMQDGPPHSTGAEGTLLSVYVDDFRFIRPATRYLTGVMSGNAFIESKLSFSDLRSGSVYGTQDASTSSSAWQGIFSPVTNKQVEAIAVGVFKQMKAAKGKN
jgi:hypothetical protein